MLDKTALLDQSYLDLRCMLLEVAATLDRLDRAPPRAAGDVPGDDPRLALVRRMIDIVSRPPATPPGAPRAAGAGPGAVAPATPAAGRAAEILLLLSDPAEGAR